MTQEFGLSVVVDRTSLALSPLELNNSTSSNLIINISGGLDSPIIDMQKSKLSNGILVSNITNDIKTAHLTVRVYGADVSTVFANLELIKAAFSQWSYTVTVTFGSNVQTWNCLPATISYGTSNGDYDSGHLRGGFQEVFLSIPRQPN
jgi:hypothetical protein